MRCSRRGELHSSRLPLPTVPARDAIDPHLVFPVAEEEHVAIGQRRDRRVTVLAAELIPVLLNALEIDRIHDTADVEAISIPHIGHSEIGHVPSAVHVDGNRAIMSHAGEAAQMALDLTRQSFALCALADGPGRSPVRRPLLHEAIVVVAPIAGPIVEGRKEASRARIAM